VGTHFFQAGGNRQFSWEPRTGGAMGARASSVDRIFAWHARQARDAAGALPHIAPRQDAAAPPRRGGAKVAAVA
jgi:hypothetical protein